MLQFKIPEKQYILSLDSLDLNFLSQYVQKPSDVERVLWSKSVEEDPAFYQVEIVSEELQNEDAFIEPYESNLCYICNLDVPKIYYKQHNKSARHQNYKKFVEKVLENVRKQINIDIDSVPKNQEYDMFYCETCCKVVARNNKRNHKKSNYHIQSIENEQLTSKFIEMYINKKNTEDDIQSEINYGRDLDSEFSSPSDSDWYDSNASIHNFMKNCKKNNVLNISNNSNAIEEVEIFQKYLKEMIAKYNLDIKLPSMEGNSVVIVTPKGYKEKITIDAFHSYKKMNGFAFCLTCQKWVQENTSQHSVSEEHVRNIFQPVNDNFAREVVNDKQYIHCLICNERVLKTSNHVQCPKPSVPKSNECESSPLFISDMKSSSILNKEPSESNLSKSAIDTILPRNTDIGTVEEKLKEYKKQFSVINASQIKCLVCPNSIVPYVDNNIITHVEGRHHRQVCANLFLKNSVKKISLSQYYCNLCNQSIDDFLNHIKSHDKNNECDKSLESFSGMKSSSISDEETSESNLSKSVIDSSLSRVNTNTGKIEEKLKEYSKQFSVVNANNLKCLVCPYSIVPYDDNNIITHVVGRLHRQVCANLFLKNSLKKISLSQYYCNLCNQFIDDFLHHIKSHDKNNECDKSPESFSGMKSSSISDEEPSESNLSKSVIDSSLSRVNTNTGTVEEKLKEYRKQFSVVNANNLRCLVCPNSIVPYDDNNIITHVEGRPHRQVSANLFLKNSLKKISLSQYYCNLCNQSIDDFLNHIKWHDKNNECDKSPESFSDMKSSSISDEESSESNLSKGIIDSSLSRVNTNTGTVEEKLKEYRKQFSVVNANNLRCLVCPNSIVPYVDGNIITHVEGRPHRQVCANLFLKNSLEKISLSLYYCNSCNQFIDDFLHHIKSHDKNNECDKSPESFSGMKSSSISDEEPSESNLSKSVIDSSLSRVNTNTGTVEEKLKEYRKQFSVVNANNLRCLVCPNSIVPYDDNNIITHVEGRPHRQVSANLFLKNSLKKISLSQYYCNLCNQSIDDFLNHIKWHDKNNECDKSPESFSDMKSSSISDEESSESNLSKGIIDSSLSRVNTNTGTVEEKLKEYRKQFSVVNANNLRCLVCPNSIVPYVDGNIITHVEGRPHRQVCANLFLKNSLEKISLSLYYCNSCNQFIDDFLHHIKSHDKNNECDKSPESFSGMKSSSISDEEPSESNLSKSVIDSSLSRVNTNTGTVEEKLKEYRKQFSVVNANNLRCLVCPNSIVPYVDNNIITHVEGRPHSQACTNLFFKNSLRKISSSLYYCNLCNKFIDDFLNHIKSHVEHKPIPIKDIGGSKKQFKKYVYEDPLNLSPIAIECRKKYKVALQQNLIVPLSDKRFNCNVCLTKMSRISEIDHMFGERHRLAMSSASNAS